MKGGERGEPAAIDPGKGLAHRGLVLGRVRERGRPADQRASIPSRIDPDGADNALGGKRMTVDGLDETARRPVTQQDAFTQFPAITHDAMPERHLPLILDRRTGDQVGIPLFHPAHRGDRLPDRRRRDRDLLRLRHMACRYIGVSFAATFIRPLFIHKNRTNRTVVVQIQTT